MGSKHKVKYDFGQICHDNDFNPCLELIKLARNGANDRIRLDATIELASYVAPKLKAIELTTPDDGKGFTFTMNFNPPENANDVSDVQRNKDGQ